MCMYVCTSAVNVGTYLTKVPGVILCVKRFVFMGFDCVYVHLVSTNPSFYPVLCVDTEYI